MAKTQTSYPDITFHLMVFQKELLNWCMRQTLIVAFNNRIKQRTDNVSGAFYTDAMSSMVALKNWPAFARSTVCICALVAGLEQVVFSFTVCVWSPWSTDMFLPSRDIQSQRRFTCSSQRLQWEPSLENRVNTSNSCHTLLEPQSR